MEHITWRKNIDGDLVGKCCEYKIKISEEPHGGFSYILTYGEQEDMLWLGQDGFCAPNLKSLFEAKNKAIKKLNFFLTQTENEKI